MPPILMARTDASKAKAMQNTYKSQYEEVITHLKTELDKLRTGRATPVLVEDILIEAYHGYKQKVKELASISVPEPRTLVIKPWDKGIIKEIEKGLINSALEFNPIVETELLRIKLPELTQETREKIIKKLRAILEENRIKIRGIRDVAKKQIETQQKSGEITEDDKFRFLEELNDCTREYTEQIDNHGKKKEEEIMTI